LAHKKERRERETSHCGIKPKGVYLLLVSSKRKRDKYKTFVSSFGEFLNAKEEHW
jgi:hypothetical protein